MDKSILKNITSLFLVQGVGYILPLVTLPYLVRVLGPTSYGNLGFSLALIQYFILLTQYGFEFSATKEIAVHKDNKDKVSEIFWSVIYCKISLLILSAILLLIATQFVPLLKQHDDIVFASFVSVIGMAFLPSWLFQGKEKMGRMAIYNILARFLTVPATFLLVHTPQDAWVAALITSSGIVLATLFSLIIVYLERWVDFRKPNIEQINEALKGGWHIFLSNIAGNLYINSIPVFLGFMTKPETVGQYVAADKIRQAIQGLMGPVTQVFYPRISALMSTNKSNAIRLIKGLFGIQCAVALFISLLMFIFAENIILMLYSKEYTEAIILLQLISPLVFIISISNVLGVQGMLTMGMKKAFSAIVWFGAVINTIIIFPLIYYYQAEGAAISVLITEVLIMLIIFYKVRKIWSEL
ncbi:flippase [Leclercia sp. EC_58]|uniref:flippase n=1 Tax=Leclercia sp. EC_58 TaxID=2584090 RepID=UPI001C70387D|nr:flippase [Leclercia sp. EC_58]MBW9402018.1 flippase [Leclercia sp. EC_58]